MLSEEERREIEHELTRYPTRQAVSIDAMKIVQKHRGWVSDEALRDIAEFLQLPMADLDGVATFYNLIFRKPVGRHVIYFCDSVSCWIMGAPRQHDHLCERLGAGRPLQAGETTTDGRFTLLPIVCLGACDHAPVMMVDSDLHTDLTPARIDRILEEYN
ncbi:MAG TPA: NADH-quinone oxidoreductase subunit NuoE [Bryobacteraceae bacterium]|nr:NADH-quinone oxidoreductase subunit NuoE [Bryobacteraceae bacterium]